VPGRGDRFDELLDDLDQGGLPDPSAEDGGGAGGAGPGSSGPDPLLASAAIEERAALKARVRGLQQLLAVFLKAGKTLRLYSENHRYFEGFAEEFQRRVQAEFEYGDALTFEVTPQSMNWDGHVIFENREQRENLAFKLYRDGVRLLQFRRGLGGDEIREFVSLVAREVDTQGANSKDLSVLFWEADFKHIGVAIAETFVEYSGETANILYDLEQDLTQYRKDFSAPQDPAAAQRPKYEPRAKHAVSNAALRRAQLSARRRPGMDDAQGIAAVKPSAAEEAALEGALEMPQLPRDAFDDQRIERVYEDLHGLEDPYASFEEVGAVIAEVVVSETIDAELRQFLRHLDEALSPLLATAGIGPLNSILRRAALLARAYREEGDWRGAILSEFFVKLAQQERLSLLAQAINAEWDDGLKGELFTFVSLQHPDAFEQIIRFLEQVSRLPARRVIIDALLLLSGRSAADFLPALRSPRWNLCADAVYALGRIGDPTSIDQVVGAFSRDEHSVRVEVLNALRPYQSPRISELMLRALTDAHEEVRLAALRYLAVYRV
jgi:hypothetical protein